MRKSAIGISLLHFPLPDLILFEKNALILRIDYLSLDPTWVSNNEIEHISSTQDRQIIELVPSPLPGSAGLIPNKTTASNITEKHIVIFTYSDTLDLIDWESFPDNIQVFVF